MTSPKRRGLGDTDPLARPRRTPAVIPSSLEAEDDSLSDAAAVDQAAAATAAPPAAPARPERARGGSAGKTKLSVYIDDAVLSDTKNAYIALLATTGMSTLSAYVERALQDQNARLADEHNNGKAFPARTVEPRAGKPIS